MAYDPNTDPFEANGGGVRMPDGGWVPRDHPLAAQAVPAPTTASPTAAPSPTAPVQPPAAPPGPASTALSGTATAGATVDQGAPTTVTGAFQQALVNRLAPGPVSSDSPEVAPAIAANRQSEQRSMEAARAQLAERAGAQGIDQHGFNSQLMGLTQDSAQRQGQFAGSAVMGLAQQRAQELTAALSLGGAMLSDQDRMRLQNELAQLQAQISRESMFQNAGLTREQMALNAALQREGVSAQTGLGYADLGLRRDLGTGQLNLGLLNSLIGNQQFSQNLGANLGMFGANLNQNALIALLGGY
jgi:hypothetical protein